MEYRLNKIQLLDILREWDRFLKRKVHLIACGGTAITLLGVKHSTKDVDFMVPDEGEHAYLIKQLKMLDYKPVTAAGWRRHDEKFQFDLFRGNNIHTTELLESPLKPNKHSVLMEFSRLYIGILNYYDLISSKLMRGDIVDFDDCLMLVEAHIEKIDLEKLVQHFHELVSYDISQDRIRPNIERFVELLREKGLHDG